MRVSAPGRTKGHTVRHVALCAVITVALVRTSPVEADFSVTYRAKSASLVLFDKPQPSPFGALAARILIKGDRVRVEATDHWGTTHTWISDRTSHTTWRLLPDKQYKIESGGWACEGLAVQVAGELAGGLVRAGIDSLSVSGPTAASWAGKPALRTEWDFRARVFGMPKPVWVHASIYFPESETNFFGAPVVELYCGKKPPEAEWQSAFQQLLELSKDGAGALARVAGLPIALDFSSDLGVGSATLVLEATDVSKSVLDASLFELPEGYRAAPATE